MAGVDISRERAKAIEELERQAQAHYDAGADAQAADAYERAAGLLERHATGAPSRTIETARKQKALKYRGFAKALRSGDVPKGEASQTGEVSASRGSAKGKKGERKEDETREVVTGLLHHSNVGWGDIGGLSETKREIKYALGVSLAKMPPGLQLARWRNMLFYGPPGTGKTLLAAATSRALKATSEEGAVFFNVKVSSVMSKFFGESTKIISELYGTARDMSPAVVFLDEFEALCGSRNDGDTGTERRILSTILSELDGLAEKGRPDVYVLTIAATNRPWDLDPAVLSRFDKRVLIPLPDPESRRAILGIHLEDKGYVLECSMDQLVDLTEGLSGREIESLTKEVCNRMVGEENARIPDLVDEGVEALREYEIRVRPLVLEDFERARAQIHPVTTAEEMRRYESWRDAAEA